jgi:MoxR-like ATPase
MTFEDKHEPQTVRELIFADKATQATCLRYATGKPYKPLMLWGEPGTAKTTTARVIVDCPHRVVRFDC